jgi:hypothetical protein
MLDTGVDDVKKFNRLKNNLKVAQNRDTLMHCGNPDCDGIIEL